MWKSTQFERGDVVVHTRRPEWGEGVVDQAAVVNYEGRQAQRLIVRFANHGRVTVNTAVAVLQLKDLERTMASTNTSAFQTPQARQGWLDSLDNHKKSDHQELWSLPEPMTDPFASLADRLKATLDSYRFSQEARSLIDWAVAQSGLNDPLSEYSRHELEQAFVRFARDRDRHLVELVRVIKKKGRHELLSQQTNDDGLLPPARRALAATIRA